MKEVFEGNAYIFSAYTIENIAKIQHLDAKPNENIVNYLNCFRSTIKEEVKSQTTDLLERSFLEEVNLCYLDNKEVSGLSTVKVSLIITYDKISKISLITLLLLDVKVPISHLLDRMSQNFFQIDVNNELVELSEYLKQKYSLISLEFSKACLTTQQEIDERFYPYYIANETYDSQLMSTNIKSDLYGKDSLTNIAQYESSDIYTGRDTVIRIDKRDYKKTLINRIQSDVIFLFILEILMFKESSIEKTNKKVVSYLRNNKHIELKRLDKLNKEYSLTIHFWDINIFNYITAQNLANKVEESFKIKDRVKAFKENQNFLQHKLNIKQAIAQEHENNVLFIIAVILFVFEIYNIAKELIEKSASFALSGSTLIVILIIFLITKRKKLNE